MNTSDKIYIAGHKGMVGSAVVRLLNNRGFKNLILRTRKELDLRDARSVEKFFNTEKPDAVILSAARVGGIQANINHPADFLYENLAIQTNVIHQSYLHGVKAFCFLGSSCIYPRECPQPMKEEYLLTGPLEPTNEGYALAKIAGLKMIEYYHKQYGFPGVSVLPCNLYGVNDSFDPLHSHVLSALVKKFVDARDNRVQETVLWGTGTARREFMHVDDAAEAIIFVMERFESGQCVNLGWGEDVTIKQLANLIAGLVGYSGVMKWDASKPEGMPRKFLDCIKLNEAGFQPTIPLSEGIEKTITEYTYLKSKVLV
jgi:GDP-L-fucose synthase